MPRSKPLIFEENEIGCKLCVSHRKNEFGHVIVHRKSRVVGLHVITWEQHHEMPVPAGMVVRHSCDNPSCCNPTHLLIGTHADNVKDRVERNRSAKGSGHGRAKLTGGNVSEIRRCSDDTSVLSMKFKVSPSLIQKIRKGILWKDHKES